jgi:hypothetical protein
MGQGFTRNMNRNVVFIGRKSATCFTKKTEFRPCGKFWALHVRHSDLSIYHSVVEIGYLKLAEKYGSRLCKQHQSNCGLHRSKAYNLLEEEDRVAAFRVLSKLLFSIVSGKAEIRYLRKDASNHLWKVLPPDSLLITASPT